MSLFDSYENNCYQQEYGGDSGGGGNSGLYTLGGGSSDSSDFEPIDSTYRFTSPPRYYKANDPYYWEIDNIPLKQIHENCLWLKDQIIGVRSVSGIGRSKFTELQPYSTAADRQVFVRPGNYTARINDAFGKGFLPRTAGSAADIGDTLIKTTNRFDMPDEVFRTLVGTVPAYRLYNTGLFDQVQHHSVRVLPGPILDFLRGSTYTLNNPSPTSGGQEANDLPGVKLALWKQINGDQQQPGYYTEDLQQLAVTFTRRWGGVTRTAIVNVPETLVIEVPEFQDTDFLIDPSIGGTPEVRIDLIFIYSHPIDQRDSTIVNGRLGGIETITKPRLGIVKGAGAILSKAGDEGALDIISTPTLLDDVAWANQANSNTFYNETVNTADADRSINATMADNSIDPAFAPFPGKRVSSNFPSPDDLMNLAPLLADELETGSLSLVGQSVLPICYVAVKRGATSIGTEDIIDIRPFFRTTELAYNERAGVAAANPPLSLANPAVGRAQLENSLTVFKDYFVGGLLAQLEALASELEEGTLKAQPVLVAVTATSDAENGSNSNTVQSGDTIFKDFKYTNNFASELWSPNTKLMQEVGDSTASLDTINLGPGIYDISYTCNFMFTDPAYAYQTWYYIQLVDDSDSILYPNNSQLMVNGSTVENGTIGTLIAGDAGGHSDREWAGGVHFRATLINENTTGYTGYRLKWNWRRWQQSGLGAHAGARQNGTLRIKRVSNIDGSLDGNYLGNDDSNDDGTGGAPSY
mgnify:FL=1